MQQTKNNYNSKTFTQNAKKIFGNFINSYFVLKLKERSQYVGIAFKGLSTRRLLTFETNYNKNLHGLKIIRETFNAKYRLISDGKNKIFI